MLRLPSRFSTFLLFLFFLNYFFSYCVLRYCPDARREDGEAAVKPNLGTDVRADWKLGPNYWHSTWAVESFIAGLPPSGFTMIAASTLLSLLESSAGGRWVKVLWLRSSEEFLKSVNFKKWLKAKGDWNLWIKSWINSWECLGESREYFLPRMLHSVDSRVVLLACLIWDHLISWWAMAAEWYVS